MKREKTKKRFHPTLVALHWLMAIPLFLMLIMGTFAMDDLPLDSPDKKMALRGHMTFGTAVGVFLVLRLLIRIKSEHPPKSTTGNAFLDRIGTLTHWLFYLFIGVMVLSGIGIAVGAGLFPIVFGSAAASIPPEIDMVPPRFVHGIVSKLLMILILLHIAAAFYHQFLLKDGLLRRMWFGKRQ